VLWSRHNARISKGTAGLDDFYRSVFAPYVWTFSLAWCVLGLWAVLRPSMLVSPLGALVLNRKTSRDLGLSPAQSERVIEVSGKRDQLHYDDRIARIGGGLSIAAGLLGLFTAVGPVIAAALGVVILSWTAVLYSDSARRTDNAYMASLELRHPRQVVPAWLFAIFTIAAMALLYLHSIVSVSVGIATLFGVAATWRIASIPAVFFGADVELERHIDARFRLSRVAFPLLAMALLLQIWNLTEYGDPTGFTPPVIIASGLTHIAIICEISFLLFTTQRFSRDLRRVVSST
jgi:hypothetical protein